MSRLALTRRWALLLPLAVASCGDSDVEQRFTPLRFNDLPPIELTVASISIEQRFVPAGVPPDISFQDPVPPIEALKAMANDRLMAFGTENKAVFAILNASLTRQADVITGTFEVSLTIFGNDGRRLGFATAQVRSERTGRIGNLRRTLYDMTSGMMSNMNIEFEYQVRRNLKPWLTSATAPDTPVQQVPLDGSQPATPSGAPAPPALPSPSAPLPPGGLPSSPGPSFPGPGVPLDNGPAPLPQPVPGQTP